MSATARPNTDAVSEESAASVHRRPIGVGVSTNAKGAPNKNGNTRSGASDKSSAFTIEAIEADLEREVLARFVERGPPSGPARGVQHSQPSPSGTSQAGPTPQPTPNTPTSESRATGPAQTNITDNASLHQKK
ncbi:hypothetical protein EI94DRAFT_1835547 [Lactarius quietus]|nr:hypothetical protein EI94DRAFT_1835547 [Lactarius quietus]